MAINPIHAVGGVVSGLMPRSPQLLQPANGLGFTDLLTSGLKTVDTKVAKADALIEAFAEGKPIPVHQVALALEDAKIAVELAAQVRTHLLDAYREFMNMQL